MRSSPHFPQRGLALPRLRGFGRDFAPMAPATPVWLRGWGCSPVSLAAGSGSRGPPRHGRDGGLRVSSATRRSPLEGFTLGAQGQCRREVGRGREPLLAGQCCIGFFHFLQLRRRSFAKCPEYRKKQMYLSLHNREQKEPHPWHSTQ